MAVGGSNSTLGNIASRAEQVRKIRTRLGMSDAPGTPRSGRVQAAAPTNPASGFGDQDDDIESHLQQAQTGNRDKMLELIKQKLPMLTQQDVGGAMVAGPDHQAPAPRMENPLDYLQPENRNLLARLGDIGAVSLSPVEQFARLAGRMPAPRELVIFQARSTLEQQLGRPPTPVELKIFVMRPEERDSTFQPAFEG